MMHFGPLARLGLIGVGLVLVLVFAAAVVKQIHNDMVTAVAHWIENRVVRIWKKLTGGGISGGADPAERLTRIISERLEAEHDRLNLASPRPLEVRWAGKLPGGVPVVGRGRLVILGRAGSGKSVLVRRLALDLLKKNPGGPVPVIFGLASWTGQAGLKDWLIGELASVRYDPELGEKGAGKLLEEGKILPVFDGFDEIASGQRPGFLRGLNRDWKGPLVLTSRPEKYHVRALLDKAEVITLEDLETGDALRYLREVPEQNDDGRQIWEPVADELLKNPPTESAWYVREALTTPLMVAIARDVYSKEGDPADLLKQCYTSKEDVEDHLLRSFVPAIYMDSPPRWTPRQAERALGYLAMRLESDIAWWRFGIAAMSAWKRSLLCGLASGLVMAVANGTVTLAAVFGADGFRTTPTQGVEVVAGDVAAIAFGFGLAHWLVIRYRGYALEPSWTAIRVARLFGLSPGGRFEDVRPAAGRFRDGLVVGGVAGLTGILGVLICNQFQTTPGESAPWRGWTALLVSAIAIALMLGLTLGTIAVTQVRVEVTSAAGPLTLLDANRRIATRVATLAGVMSGAAMGVIAWIGAGPVMGAVFAVIGGITIAVGGMLSMSPWGQWVLFGRVWLPLTRRLPWRAREFLDDAHQRGVLRAEGGFYQFRHERLRELYKQEP
jgi:hypothetical protein